jgi:hypothetical protein
MQPTQRRAACWLQIRGRADVAEIREHGGVTTPAVSDVYALLIDEPSRRNRAWRWVAVAASNLLLEGQGPQHRGGNRAVIVDRATGREVGEVVEGLGADGHSAFAAVRGDIERLDADEFRAMWIESSADGSAS